MRQHGSMCGLFLVAHLCVGTLRHAAQFARSLSRRQHVRVIVHASVVRRRHGHLRVEVGKDTGESLADHGHSLLVLRQLLP